MKNDWIYMEAIDKMPDVNIVHCDTRDFHIFLSQTKHVLESHEEFAERIVNKIKKGKPEDYMFARSEILGCLAALEANSGGKRKWRYLELKDIKGWTKYLRFVKYKDGYIACDREYVPLKRQWLNAENIIHDNDLDYKTS